MKTAIVTITNVVFLLQFGGALEKGGEASSFKYDDFSSIREHDRRSLQACTLVLDPIDSYEMYPGDSISFQPNGSNGDCTWSGSVSPSVSWLTYDETNLSFSGSDNGVLGGPIYYSQSGSPEISATVTGAEIGVHVFTYTISHGWTSTSE